MKSNNLLPISKDGWQYLAPSVVAFVIFYIFDFSFLAFIAFSLTLLFIFMFRNPEREFPVFEKLSVVSPCDGTVKSITELTGGEFAYKVDIESSCSDVGILRVPMNAIIQELSKFNGTRVSQNSKLFIDTNERLELLFIDEDSNKLKVEHRLTKSFLPIFVDIESENRVSKSSRYGFLNSGITTLYLPSNFRLNVNVGNDVKASDSLIGYFS